DSRHRVRRPPPRDGTARVPGDARRDSWGGPAPAHAAYPDEPCPGAAAGSGSPTRGLTDEPAVTLPAHAPDPCSHFPHRFYGCRHERLRRWWLLGCGLLQATQGLGGGGGPHQYDTEGFDAHHGPG